MADQQSVVAVQLGEARRGPERAETDQQPADRVGRAPHCKERADARRREDARDGDGEERRVGVDAAVIPDQYRQPCGRNEAEDDERCGRDRQSAQDRRRDRRRGDDTGGGRADAHRRAPQQCLECGAAQRILCDEPDGTAVVEALADLIGAPARDQHDRRPRGGGGRDPLGHFVAAHVGEADVEQHHLGRQAGDGEERVGAVGGLADDVELVELEQLARRRPETGVVVDDHEGAHVRSSHLAAPAASEKTPRSRPRNAPMCARRAGPSVLGSPRPLAERAEKPRRRFHHAAPDSCSR